MRNLEKLKSVRFVSVESAERNTIFEMPLGILWSDYAKLPRIGWTDKKLDRSKWRTALLILYRNDYKCRREAHFS